ncbi:MAG: hypothetical protein EXR98_24360 [Gemmataceae bacterium]|nr:hypothetical protein [Gemmataceae bacterium]
MQRNSTAPVIPGKPTTTSNARAAGVATPAKPYPDYPLFAHRNGQWAKKIRGRLVYFGLWSDTDGALAKYLEQKDDLHAGRKPRVDPEAFTVKDLANAFLNHKTAVRETGELSIHTWNDYKRTCDLIVSTFGKQRLITDLRPEDFAAMRKAMAKKWGLQRIAKCIQFVRCVFKYGYDAELIATPVRFGPGFARPSKKAFRIDKAKNGPKLFARDEILAMLDGCNGQLRAMILLGVNCGLGNSDCGSLPITALNLETRWLDYARPKTGIPRRTPLWPETVEAIKEVIDNRPTPNNPAHAGLLFVTKYGGTWGKDTSDNPISKEMRKLLDRLGINGHRNFYVLRHVFRTVADDSQDQPACDFIMGHSRDDMASVYRETISDKRLQTVADHVHGWLFGTKEGGVA